MAEKEKKLTISENDSVLDSKLQVKCRGIGNTLLALDLSTTCTGWALFNVKTKELLACGRLKGSEAGMAKMVYPEKPLTKIKQMAAKAIEIAEFFKPDIIFIEEINLGKNRHSQKTLDGLHWFVVDMLLAQFKGTPIRYMDSDGREGWRGANGLGHLLSDSDKEYNKQIREFNKKVKKDQQKEVLTKKHVTARWVNKTFGKTFDIDKNETDSDVSDAIGLGYAATLTINA